MNIDVSSHNHSLNSTHSSQESTANAKQKEEATFSDAELKEIQKLKARDQEERTHEAAHIAAGGGVVKGGASYSCQKGPDGIQYAIGGEVSIDTSKVAGNPEATLQKAQKIQAAALAPADPSSQDRKVAASAAQMAVEARAEIQQQNQEEVKSTNSASSSAYAETKESGESLIDLSV